MSIVIRYIKMLFYGGENIEHYGIYQGVKDGLYHMRVKCDCCDETQCRCFESISEAMEFEGYICSNKCFVLACQGDDETLDALIEGLELGDTPLASLDDAVFDELVSGIEDTFDEEYECPVGKPCSM